MILAVRQKGSRRFDLPAEFPLMDSQGIFVIKNRRQLTDRRMPTNYLDVVKIMLSELTDE
jgi:hypothetical protein